MSKPVQVEVVLSNSEHLPIVDVWLAVDVLRASTVIVSWFAAGGDELYPADSVDSARLLAEQLKQDGKRPILMGEQNAIAPQGFDLGNSPLEITTELVRKNPCGVMATTNGTVAMLKAASTGVPVLVACFRNASAALDAALSRGRRIGIFCSGRKGRPAWDDTLCAGLLVSYLTKHFPDTHLADSARLAHLTWLESKDCKSSLRSADHAVFLEKIGYGDDVAFAGEIDAVRVVPELYELPEGDGMRAVLRLGASKLSSLNDSPLSSSLVDGRSEAERSRVDSPTALKEEGLFDHLSNANPAWIFFASEKYKKRKGNRVRK